MGAFYNKFKELGLDLTPLSLEDRGPNGGYFCTPVGANCIGWPGVDGIHFCFIRGHREMVFAVSPMNGPGEYVHPIARTFRDFLRLLLSCGVDALEQIYAWDRAQFEAFVRDCPRSEDEKQLLDRIAAEFSLKPMKDPYGYVKNLQEAFDFGTIMFSQEYYDTLMEQTPWAVYFSGARFGVTEDAEQPGREVVLNRAFDWEGQEWKLLSVYVCEDGLVGDFCIRVDPAAEAAFLKKWTPILENGLTREQEDLLQLENPFVLDVRVFADINGVPCRNFHGSQDIWNPCTGIDEGRSWEAEQWLKHYGCDREQGWIFLRSHWRHQWQGKQLETLALTLKEDDARIPGLCFSAQPGTQAEFIRPSTGEKHMLIVEEGPEEQTFNTPELHGMILPNHCRVMTYRVEPELPQGVLMVQDNCGGDPPRPAQVQENEFAACVGIIGGADGPTAICFTRPGEKKRNTAVSSLYFDLPEKTTWRMLFREPRRHARNVDIELPAGGFYPPLRPLIEGEAT